MSTVELGAENLEHTLTDNEIVVVDFWASWRGPGLQFAPVYESASLTYPQVVFGKIDTEAERAPTSAAPIKKKVDADVGSRVILGACRPQLAHVALQVDPSIATPLPTNGSPRCLRH